MSERDNYLLVDIGNTSIKYAQYSVEQGLSDVHSAENPQKLAGLVGDAKKVLLASVAKDEQVALWKDLCQQHETALFIAKTESQTFGLRCAYENYDTLGVDRWLAILGSRSLTSKPFAVIDIGTALTCDVVVGDQHLGGWIMPGFELMRTSLIKNTAKVFGDDATPSRLGLGNSTPDCVNQGCQAAIQGAVKMASESLIQHSNDFDLLITGGGQKLVNELAGNNIRFEKNLVLVGLSLFIDQQSPEIFTHFAN